MKKRTTLKRLKFLVNLIWPLMALGMIFFCSELQVKIPFLAFCAFTWIQIDKKYMQSLQSPLKD